MLGRAEPFRALPFKNLLNVPPALWIDQRAAYLFTSGVTPAPGSAGVPPSVASPRARCLRSQETCEHVPGSGMIPFDTGETSHWQAPGQVGARGDTRAARAYARQGTVQG